MTIDVPRVERYTDIPAASAADVGKVPIVGEDGRYVLGSGGGSGGGVLVVTDTDGTLDKTAQEIMIAAETGNVVVKKTESPATNVLPILQFTFNTITGYSFTVFNGDWAEYTASAATDYPVIGE